MTYNMQKMFTEAVKEKGSETREGLSDKIPDFSKNNEASALDSKIPTFNYAEKSEPTQQENSNSEDKGESVTPLDKPFREIETRNSTLAGDRHPITGVEFEYKIVEDENGESVGGVFPIFDSSFDAQLPENLLDKTDKKQFDCCNSQLKEAFESDSLDNSKFSDRQLEQIKNGDKPEGFTWHHHEKTGAMQLIETDVHDKTGHTGGKSVWGGGTNAR